MNNILLTSDLHIDNWIQYSPEPDYRLNEYDKLGDRFVKLINEHQCSWIFFCGDSINTPYVYPKAFHKLSSIYKKILSNTSANIGIFLGQHDTDSKLEFNIEDTFVTTLINYDPNRVFYLHKKVVNVAGKNIYCCNWMDVDTYEIPEEANCNVFLGHVSLGFGQTISGKRDIAFCGDIHEVKSFNSSPYGDHTLGTPIQLYPDQMPDGGVITLLDLDTYNFQRLPTSGELSTGESWKFLNLKETEEYKFIVSKNLEAQEYAELVDAATSLSSKSVNLMKDIEENVKEQGLESIHNRIDKSGQPSPISFNYKIHRLKITNFLSIKHMDLNFDELMDICYVQAVNGVGKSTLLKAIGIALTGDRSMNFYNHDPDGTGLNCEECCLDITLSHMGSMYRIVRGPGLLEFYINDTQVSKNNMRELNALILSTLPFIGYSYFFTLGANRHLFESCDRLDFFKVCFNLNVYDYYAQQSKELQKVINKSIRDLNTSKKVEEDKITDLTNRITQIQDTIAESKYGIEKSEDIKLLIDTISNLESEHNRILSQKLVLESEVTSLESQIQELSKWNVDMLCQEMQYLVDSNAYKVSLSEYETSRNLLQNSINARTKSIDEVAAYMDLPLQEELELLKAIEKYNKDVEEYNSEVNRLTKLSEMSVSSVKCEHCGSDVILDKAAAETVSNAKDALSKLVVPTPVVVDKELHFRTSIECQAMINKVEACASIKEVIASETEQLNNLVCPTAPAEVYLHFSSIPEYQQLIASVNNINDTINTLNTKKELLSQHVAQLEDLDTKINNTIVGFPDIGNYKVHLVDRAQKSASLFTMKKQADEFELEIASHKQEIERLDQNISDENKALLDNIRYFKLFDAGDLDSIPNKMLQTIANNLSSDDIKVSTTKTADDGTEYFYISVRIKDQTGAWRDYDSASDGQKVIMDMYILNKITRLVGNVGLLILDESLANLSENNYRTALNLINNLQIGKCFITSFNPNMIILGSKLVLNLDKERGTYIEKR